MLEWMGKKKVVNHHNDVPFHVLERKYSFDATGKHEKDNGSGNMIIHGDNLVALKSLLPRFEGRVKCIYIDPPYNTGEEGWVYNDNVNDPQIKKWFNKIVGKEGEDFSRHDKWLCMMYPRLKLLHRLLADDGLLAVSIDDNELFNLGAMLNEIFGSQNRLACAPWMSDPSGGKSKGALRVGHEYLLLYSKGDRSSLSRDERSTGVLNLKDKWGKYRKGRELRKWGANSARADRPKQWFEITAPDGTKVFPYKNDGTEGRWRWGKENAGMKVLLSDPEYAHWEKCPYDEGVTVNGESERWVPFEKVRDEAHTFGWSTWLDKYGHNADGTAEIKAIFGNKTFDTPKPLQLVRWIVSLYDAEDTLILDSFAGSATTAHAALQLNKEDGGTRKFILVELMDYAETLTAERVRRVIKGYGSDDKKVEGTGGDFSFYELGPQLMVDGVLNEEVPTEKIREYVYYTETKQPIGEAEKGDAYKLGVAFGVAYYFCYEKDKSMTLNRTLLKKIKTKAESYVVYADACTLSAEELEKLHITFKKIPRDVTRF